MPSRCVRLSLISVIVIIVNCVFKVKQLLQKYFSDLFYPPLAVFSHFQNYRATLEVKDLNYHKEIMLFPCLWSTNFHMKFYPNMI